LRQPGNSVTIEVNGRIVHQLDLNTSQQITVTGSVGKTIIKIDQGTAQVIYSDCPEKICIKTGKIHHTGEMIVCVPNKVVAKINGKRNNQFDVITQ
ncbi:MAG: NusG domain II-containing protein, partial [bacterium]